MDVGVCVGVDVGIYSGAGVGVCVGVCDYGFYVCVCVGAYMFVYVNKPFSNPKLY